MINNCHHGEAFLWNGTGVDEVDDAIMDLVRLTQLNEEAGKEIADLISSTLSTINKFNAFYGIETE